jgi:hypothetical protein
MPLTLGDAPAVCSTSLRRRDGSRPEISKAEREHTPPELCLWLVELARRCVGQHHTATLSFYSNEQTT